MNKHRAAAPFPPTFEYATKFEVESESYQRRVPISHLLKPGEGDRFTIRIGMDKSSLHSFKARVVYNDGHESVSPQFDLLAFVPRSGAQYAGPYMQQNG